MCVCVLALDFMQGRVPPPLPLNQPRAKSAQVQRTKKIKVSKIKKKRESWVTERERELGDAQRPSPPAQYPVATGREPRAVKRQS